MLLQYYHTKELVDAPVKLQNPGVVIVPKSIQQLNLQVRCTLTLYWSGNTSTQGDQIRTIEYVMSPMDHRLSELPVQSALENADRRLEDHGRQSGEHSAICA
jgi:hypothetical protein